MNISYVKEVLHSKKLDKDYYVIRLALIEKGVVIVKSQPLLWLTKEQFDKYTKD